MKYVIILDSILAISVITIMPLIPVVEPEVFNGGCLELKALRGMACGEEDAPSPTGEGFGGFPEKKLLVKRLILVTFVSFNCLISR